MAIRATKDVLVGLAVLPNRSIRRMATSYRTGVIDPITAAIGAAKGFGDLKRRMGKALVARMDDSVVGDAMTASGMQAAEIGRIAATPRVKAEKKK